MLIKELDTSKITTISELAELTGLSPELTNELVVTMGGETNPVSQDTIKLVLFYVQLTKLLYDVIDLPVGFRDELFTGLNNLSDLFIPGRKKH